MKISVVIPVFNEEKYIDTCLSSIFNQTVLPDEIIVVDNNSTDNTTEIAKKFAVKIIPEGRQGMTYARNTGFDKATGDIIARTDADSIVPHDWIERIKNDFTKHDIEALTGLATYDSFFTHILNVSVYLKIMSLLQKGKSTLIGPNMSITKNFWNKIRTRVCSDNTQVHEDIDLGIHILKEGGKIYCDNKLIVSISSRRIKSNPVSFFVEYSIRTIRTLFFTNHR